MTTPPRAQRRVEHCMGTVFSIDIRRPGCHRSAVDAVVDWLHRADATFSTFRADSQISRLSRGELTTADCTAEVDEVLSRCRDLEAETNGYFCAYADGGLDPSGLVKGWAIRRASDMLTAAGSTNHCVNGGGDVQCVGRPTPGSAWRVGISHPLRPGHLAAIATGTDFAVATSGNAERGAHITDPHTGRRPVAVASVTLVGADIATTDAYATAAYAMGTRAPDWIDTLTHHRGLVMFANGTRWASRDWETATHAISASRTG